MVYVKKNVKKKVNEMGRRWGYGDTIWLVVDLPILKNDGVRQWEGSFFPSHI